MDIIDLKLDGERIARETMALIRKGFENKDKEVVQIDYEEE